MHLYVCFSFPFKLKWWEGEINLYFCSKFFFFGLLGLSNATMEELQEFETMTLWTSLTFLSLAAQDFCYTFCGHVRILPCFPTWMSLSLCHLGMKRLLLKYDFHDLSWEFKSNGQLLGRSRSIAIGTTQKLSQITLR